MLRQIAIVSQSAELSQSELARVAAALQLQASRDIKRHWNIEAAVDVFPTLQDVLIGHWPIIIVDKLPPSLGGYHTDEHGQPFSLVEYNELWSLAASHEMIEMLIDPFGRSLVAAESVDLNNPGHVQYLVEACDPCQDARNAYNIGGYLVSDFYTPRYFDNSPSQGVQYSANGKVTKPLEVLPGGYITWHNLTENQWYQATFFDTFQIKQLPNPKMAGQNLREHVDSSSKNDRDTVFTPSKEAQAAIGQSGRSSLKASESSAFRINKAIKGLRRGRSSEE